MKKYLFLFLLLLCSTCYAAVDEFGGTTAIQSANVYVVNPNKNGSAIATSVSALVLTDTSKNWTTNKFVGCILQPNVATYSFWIIASNTATTITVVESDRTGGDKKDLTTYNNGTQEYRVLSNWRTEKIGTRYWIIDPMDNGFIAKAVDNFNDGSSNNGQGQNRKGYGLSTVLTTKYGATGDSALERHRILTLKTYGFNCLGTFYDSAVTAGQQYITSDLYIPFWFGPRTVTYWNDYMVTSGKIASNYWDVFDADFATNFNTAATEGSSPIGADYGATQQSYNITPYNSGVLAAIANPYFMGFEMDHEKSNWGAYHGYWFMTLAPSCVTGAGADTTNDTKAAFVNRLRVNHAGVGDTTFTALIDIGGTNEVTPPSGWSALSGYDADKNTTALNNLNTAWTSSFADWTAVYNYDGTDGFLAGKMLDISGNPPRGVGDDTYGCSVAAIKTDLDDLGTQYFRREAKVIYDQMKQSVYYGWKLFSPEAFYPGSINTSIRLGYDSMADGCVSATGTKYYDWIGSGQGLIGGWDGTSSITLGSSLQYHIDAMDTIGIPTFINTSWIASLTDSDRGIKGTVTSLPYNVLVHGVTDAANNTGTTVKASNAVTIDYDNMGSPGDYIGQWACYNGSTCRSVFANLDTGQTSKVTAYVSTTQVTLADNGVTGNSTNYEIRAYNQLVDSNADFDGPNDYNLFLNATSGSEKYIRNLTRIKENDLNQCWIRIGSDITSTSIDFHYYGRIWTDYPNQTDYAINDYPQTVDLRDYFEVGDEYTCVVDPFYNSKWIPQTQEERANFWVNWKRLEFMTPTAGGNYMMLGSAWWSIWDYGAGNTESNNFGLLSSSDNTYDGTEATLLGADGTASTVDDEYANYGDAVTAVSAFQNGIYDELEGDDTTAPTAAITYSPTGSVSQGTELTITATFSEAMADSPVVKIAISGANTVSATNMTKTDSTHYYYTHTVGAGNGTATVSLSVGTDVATNVITSTPTSGATFTVSNEEVVAHSTASGVTLQGASFK